MEIKISVGELLDKITILHIKKKLLKDEKKLANVQKEYEYLKAFLGISSDVSIIRLRKQFERFIEENNVKLKDNRDVYINGELKDHAELIKYLLLPKTLYPKGSLLGKPTIWNYVNLDRKKELFICSTNKFF
jgi:hypothetical protein